MKLSDIIPDRRDYLGHLAYLIVVITAYVTTFTYIPSLFSSPQLALFLFVGFVYTILGIFGETYVDKKGGLYLRLLYFLVQILLGGIITYISRGAGWLALIPLASHSVTLLPRWGVFLISSALLGVLIIQGYLITRNFQDIATSLVSLLAAIIFVVAFTQITVSEQSARLEVERLANQLSQANQQLREYASRAEELAAAEERNRIAREIHDGLGHYLTALNMQLKASQAIFHHNQAAALESLSKAQTLAQEALADVRRSVSALRADPAGKKSLPNSLQELIEENSSTELNLTYQQTGQAQPLSPQAELALFRSAQEGITNIRKHALATQAVITLDYATNQVTLTLKDNGIGVTDPGKGYGLLGLRERLHLLGGEIQIYAKPGNGFTLTVTLPVQSKDSQP
jgi:signal transduction histidine kinase